MKRLDRLMDGRRPVKIRGRREMAVFDSGGITPNKKVV
jgi:hypothetical protein